MVDICFYLTHYPMCKGYKFSFLADELRKKGLNIQTILCSTEMTGVRPGEFSHEEIDSMATSGTYIMEKKDVLKYVKKHKFKYFVLGTYSGDLRGILKTVRSRGSKVVEISTLGFNDPVEHNADINLLISKMAFKAAVNKRPKRAKKARNVTYTGSLFADDIPNTYTSSLRSVDDFKKKYKIDKPLFIWMPGREDLLNYPFQKRLISKTRKNATILVKPHPWSYKLHKKQIKKVSSIMPVVDARDAYWANKSMIAAVGINSTVGIELAVMKKPIVYLKHASRRPFINKKVGVVGITVKSESDLYKIINTGKVLQIKNDQYDRYLKRIYPTPFIPAYLRICKFFEDLHV